MPRDFASSKPTSRLGRKKGELDDAIVSPNYRPVLVSRICGASSGKPRDPDTGDSSRRDLGESAESRVNLHGATWGAGAGDKKLYSEMRGRIWRPVAECFPPDFLRAIPKTPQSVARTNEKPPQ
jgi:hypothetical protein